ncbi:MAG: aminotransferase class I/II-fold pyridoxal phosphate-dependent enzyme [Deltaproteobacteria bacterium]|jgi:threonine-phosphate decarboxylase|nr:aminotransferase class I/II-fold pyridoxal phosphate-dependent enzyme [Deltaproteobacteria bacterium]
MDKPSGKTARLTEKRHGGGVVEAARALNKNFEDIIDFSANINPLGLPEGLKELLGFSIDSIVHYPEIRARTLREKIARMSDLSPSSIFVEAGSTPLIYMLARHLGTQNNCVIAPAFSEYAAAFEIMGRPDVHYHVLTEADEFLLTQESVNELVSKQHDLVILANPANPTGRRLPPASLNQLMRYSSEKGFFLVLDEAFMGFCEDQFSMERAIHDFPYLIVLKSLTKLFAIPGLRLGYMVSGNNDVINTFEDRMEPWSVNSLAQKAGLFLLDQKRYVEDTPANATKLRNFLTQTLSPFFDFFDSECNFVMARIKDAPNAPRMGPPKDPQELEERKLLKKKVVDYLYAQGILIRDLDGMKGLDDGFVRLAVRPQNETICLRKSLESFYAQTV